MQSDQLLKRRRPLLLRYGHQALERLADCALKKVVAPDAVVGPGDRQNHDPHTAGLDAQIRRIDAGAD